MGNDLTNSERIANLADKIFLTNHNIVNLMLSSYRDEEFKKAPLLNRAVEKKAFEQLGKLFEELRNEIIEAIDINDEIERGKLDGLYREEVADEIVVQMREKFKQSVVDAIKGRFEADFISMNFVPITYLREGDGERIVDNGVYEGKAEEHLRGIEYAMLRNSIDKQIEIIEYEEFFERNDGQEYYVISPIIASQLIDTISDRVKFGMAEDYCESCAKENREHEDVFDEYPELAETTEFIEYLTLEERYKRLFDEYTGLLNSRTTYSKYFFSLYKDGNLPMYTLLSKEEISERMQTHIQAYRHRTQDIIQSEYEAATKKYKSVRTKRNIKYTSGAIKGKISNLGKKEHPKKPQGENPEEKKKETKPQTEHQESGEIKKMKKPGDDGSRQ